ncbi:MAG: NADH peroxidase, partial [Ruminococcus sp.]|nr:NADH peroxidase [Ruminococcus sp.]
MAKFVCSVCGYVHEGDAPPEKCPQCGVPASKFNEVKEDGELVFACEHVLGVAKDVTDPEILDGLRSN